MSFFYWNPTYWLFVAPAIVLMLIAQWRVQRAYAKWSKVRSAAGVSGMKAAEQLMAQNGLHGVGIRGIEGTLSDNYDPRSKTLNLSRSNAMGDSVASLAVIAHEIGHAMQDAKGYLPLRLRSGLVPVVNFGSRLGPILFLVGILLQFGPLMWLGIIFFASAFAFALVTLPVELDASRRAIRMLDSSNLLVDRQDRQGARAVLNAAALTYVAGMLTALVQLLYYIFLARGRRR
jgi:Zn-dependent membrane protease YugP